MTGLLLQLLADRFVCSLLVYFAAFMLVADRQRRAFHLLISLDQWLFCLLTLGTAAPDETCSAAAYRMELEGKFFGRYARPFIDWLFSPWGSTHCKEAFEDELLMRQLPRRYRG